MAWTPPQNVGDHDPTIVDAKKALRRYSYGQNLGETDEYTVEFGVALRQFQANRHTQVSFGQVPGPDLNLTGVLDWATKKQLGILPNPPKKPVIFTVAGHVGDMFTGPAYLTAKWLEDNGLARVQPVGYDNVAIPFNTGTGISELLRLINDPAVLPPGTNWALGGHSQGAIVTSTVLENNIRSGVGWPWDHFKGGVAWGNPWREEGVVASFVADPPDPDTEGLSERRIVNTPSTWQEVARTGDLYSATKHGAPETEMKRAVYQAVAESRIFGVDTLSEQIGQLVTNFGPEVWAVFIAIVEAIGFAVNQDPHNIFDLGPSVDHFRNILGV
jgi:hypothetical protein